MKTAVVALGKIGLPLAVQFADAGHEVTGVDTNPRQVELINQATEPFPGEAHLQEKLSELVPAGKLRATTDYAEAIPDADAIVIVVPLFVNDATWEPDFGWMDAATRSLAEHITPGTLVSYETTLPVGTLRGRFVPMIEEISGLKESVDFHAVFSPERVLTGRVFEDLRKYPKLIGALTAEGTAKAREFYESALQFDERPDLHRPNGVWDLGTPEASELAKLAETTYRDVNIGLANEFALFAQDNGIDVYKVIEASNSQPYSHIHQPGIAVGGHCIPVYPRLYLSTDPKAETVRTARTLNASVPAKLVERASSLLGDLSGMKAVVLGASYRTGVKETAFSGVFPVVEALREHGAEVAVHDTYYDDEELADFGWAPYHVGEEADLVIVQTNHAEYKDLTAADVPGVKLVIDGRNITIAENWTGTPRLVLGDGSASTHQQAEEA
ncbi:nucleotide sugar dehydrogenase [Brachybacterium alimentarium]|uniref:nucleotide sugar dehydrogenase n=1 Tax=Brachybacterium alimentarium TaxID=47845 RepID=UPI000DF476E1|nr:nucleotide sugar dehydrogenase [Brachybacterium alimentarium]RCS82518.1 nucleotide sugar dehydrogenase [Brachybacterium alimentarium]RCS83978.1 nucleotide sugar dehydrogenase [Brachybacterium alimentarium]